MQFEVPWLSTENRHRAIRSLHKLAELHHRDGNEQVARLFESLRDNIGEALVSEAELIRAAEQALLPEIEPPDDLQ